MASAAADPKVSDVYRQIAIRLGNFRPNIQMEKYIAGGFGQWTHRLGRYHVRSDRLVRPYHHAANRDDIER
jgi:hypothetical protein